MVSKDIYPFAPMTDGWKKGNFMESFDKIHTFCENFTELVSKMQWSWENPVILVSLQPSVTVAKGKLSFAKMTHGCKWYVSLCNQDWWLE